MTDRWQQIEQIYHAALTRDDAKRAAYLQEACAGDDDLREEVESLLLHEKGAKSFLDAPAMKVAAKMFAENSGQSMIGRQLGAYRVVSLIGSGGMGEVYQAHDMKLGREVAIKVLPAIFLNDPERLSRFQREARMLASLNHPNIATIHGFEQIDGVNFLVMELVPGKTLAERIKAGPIQLEDALKIARQIAEALETAHERGVIHRDMKPANVKMTPDGRVKVLDFGLAKISGEESALDLSQAPTLSGMVSEEGRILGTPAYMSPEQARGLRVDKRTDIWAFGCVLYEMLTGRKPFEGQTLSDTIVAILKHEPDWNALPEKVPANIRRLLRRCLEKDSRQRLRDIGDARIELDDTTTDSTMPLASSSVGRRSSRELLAWTLVAVILATSIFILVRIRMIGVSSGSNAAPSFTRVTRLTSGPALDYGPAVSPDGKWVAYLSDSRGPVDLWVKFVAGGEAINLTASSTLGLPSRIDIGGLAISPDGTNISVDAGSTKDTPSNLYDAWVIPAPLGGIPRKLVQRGRALRWSPDGTKIAYVRAGASAGDSLLVADADGGNPREIVPIHGGMHLHWPAWSHDGKYIYFNYTISTSNSEPSSIYRVPAIGGHTEPVVASERRAEFPSLTPDGQGMIFAANPVTAELGLWWQSLRNLRSRPQSVTNGIGEYAEPSLSADGRKLAATLYDLQQSLVAIPAGARAGSDAPHPLTDGYGGDFDPALSPQGDRLVFSSARSGNRNLWTADSKGSEARPLTSGPTVDERPCYSPDGTRIAFVSARDNTRGIWVMNADGGAARVVVKAQVLDALSWSPDGQKIVYATPAGDVPGLSIVTVNDGSVQRLPTPGPATGPRWSPSGDMIAYVEARRASPDAPNSSRVAFVNASGEPVFTNLDQSPNVLNGFLAWSSDGRNLAAIVDPGATTGAVWVIDVGRKEPWRKLIDFPSGVRLRGAARSPDGMSLIVGQIRRTSDIVLFE
jgi:eukaryotic-like serine/threonine-protein kinase